MLRSTCAVALVATALARPVVIDNTKPRLTSTGIILDGHDGSLQKFSKDGPYYLHTLAYGPCREPAEMGCDQTADKCGFQQNHTVEVYTSPDLSSGSWTHVGRAMEVDARPAGTLFRPYAVYNPNTKQYVMWHNWVSPEGVYKGYAASVSPAPEGPFKVVRDIVPLSHSNDTFHAGDFHLFVDEDGTGYAVYSANFYMWLDRLTPDFLSTTGEWVGPLGAYFTEAPAMFRREVAGKPLYYITAGHCCCFCQQGSGVLVYTAPSPLGPWTAQGGDKACVAQPATSPAAPATSFLAAIERRLEGTPTPDQGCLYNGSTAVSVTQAQQTTVAEVETPTGKVFMYIGDRWQQSPDGLKAHDPQYWYPLEFDEEGVVQELRWVDNFTIDVL